MAPDPHSPRPSRAPRDYRPDVRPLLLVGILLVAVVIGWVILSPMILPAR